MDRIDRFDVFNLDNYEILDQQTQVPKIDLCAVVNNRQSNLSMKVETCFAQFMGEACFVSTLQQSGTQGRMDFHCSPNDQACDVVNPGRSSYGSAGHKEISFSAQPT